MTIQSLNPTFNLSSSITNARDVLNDLQRQLATGKTAETYGELGAGRTEVLSFRAELAQLEGYQRTADITTTRLEVAQLALKDIREQSADTQADALGADFTIQSYGQSTFQAEARARFVNIVGLLNTKVGDSYIFGGRSTQSPVTAPAEEILDGGVGQAGFKEVAEERRQADLGADGLGRLAITAPATDTVNLAEDAAGHPFGFKISNVQSSLTGTTVTGPAGAPIAVGVTFTATLPNDGDSVTVTLDLPDGTSTNIELTARSSDADDPGEFLIGADADATAANFQTALNSLVSQTATTKLRTASLYEAADNFFDYTSGSTPQRVVGPPFDSATALTNATSADTVLFYKGEISTTSARASAVAKIDDSVTVSVGVRANEDAFREVLKNFAVLSVETFVPDNDDDKARYSEIANRVHFNLQFNNGAQSVDNIVTELLVSQEAVGNAANRHQSSQALLKGFVDERESADIYEVSASIVSLQARLEASLAASATLSRISLINYL